MSYKTLKIGGLDHLFGIPVISTHKKDIMDIFKEFLIFTAKNNRVKNKLKMTFLSILPLLLSSSVSISVSVCPKV